jgi:hypothetical protein
MVHQFRDRIFLRNDDGESYSGTLEDFARHFGEPMPPMPQGITQRIYEPDKRHALQIGNNVVDGGPLPWTEGDDALARVDEMIQMMKDDETAKADEAKRQSDETIAAINADLAKQANEAEAKLIPLRARREAARAKLHDVLQRAGANQDEATEIIEGLFPNPQQTP